MLDPYENILIGNFLYGLGLVIGQRSGHRELPAVVNLLQQTPLDGPLSDVYLGYPGIVRLIEFKRQSNRSSKEEAKHKSLVSGLMEKPHLEAVSRSIHWYVESAPGPTEWTAHVRPYLDLGMKTEKSPTLRSFTEELAGQALAIGEPEFPDRLIQEYLEVVALYSGGKGSSSGLLLSVNGKGELRYIALDGIHELRLENKLLHAQTMEKSRQMRLGGELENTRENSRSRGHSYEP